VRRNRRRGPRAVVRIARVAVRAVVAIAIAGGVAFAATDAAARVAAHPYFGLREVRVVGTRVLDRRAVLAWSALEPGSSLWRIDVRGAVKLLERNPRVRSAEVERQFPRGVRITIEEREPIAVLLGRAGALFVDRDGQFFPPLGDEPFEGLPYVSGIRMDDLVRRPDWAAARLRQAIDVLDLWRSRVHWPPLSEVRPEPSGEVVAYPERTPMVIRFGAEVREEQFSRLATVFGLWRGREADVSAVDLSVPGQVVLRLRSERDKGRERERCPQGGCRLEI
jgi:hypothetical protein